MDKNLLEIEVRRFIDYCEKKKKPISKFCLEEAYPGDSTTSYILQLKINWYKDCYSALKTLTNFMFTVMPVEARKRIYALEIIDQNDELACDKIFGPQV